ncbi:hypothetical protein VM1G_02893 [Cytospora mali]|uniref:Uncharacterized protein n=1 Tax=Cytospora mali TaxID=578113 RepID=A0A194VUW0_CYTMA|nr:hypothetical protein VM1G_02893 [Valsa mali]
MHNSGGDQGHKKRRPSFWGCRPSGTRSTGGSRESKDQRSDASSSKTNSPSSRRPSDPSPSRRHHSDRKKKVGIDLDPRGGFWSSSTCTETMDYDDFPTRRSPRLIMRPFSEFVARVKRCPWMLGSDAYPLAASSSSGDVFFPPVPRSLLHDTTVSFVITDHTRVEQPQFVISCPLENVELVQRLFAPEGSHRQLSARGSSRQPRSADQLRSMLLDGTPNIELSLHWGTGLGFSSAGHNGPGGGSPFGPEEGFEFQGNVFPRRQGPSRGDVAGRPGWPSDAGSNGGPGAPAGSNSVRNGPVLVDSWGRSNGSKSSANEHAQSSWDVNATSQMSEPVGKMTTLPTSHPQSHSPVINQQTVQLDPNHQELPVMVEPVAHPEPEQTQGATFMPKRCDAHSGTNKSFKKATVESAGSSPQIAPIEVEENRPAVSAEHDIIPWMTPLETPVYPQPTPTNGDYVVWRTPRETPEDKLSNFEDREATLDNQTLPVLQVLTPPETYIQEPHGGLIPSLGRWWWPGNPESLRYPSYNLESHHTQSKTWCTSHGVWKGGSGRNTH